MTVIDLSTPEGQEILAIMTQPFPICSNELALTQPWKPRSTPPRTVGAN